MTKQLTVIAGPNGSGKTTFAREFLSQHAALYLGADAIAEALSPGSPEAARVAAGRLFLERVDEALAGDRPLAIESTLSGRCFGRVLEQARRSGFSTTIVFLFLDSPETCIARVKQRVRQGGHPVPEADIRRRFRRSLQNFWGGYRLLADDWALVYNSGSHFQDVAFGSHEEVQVRDATAFQRFLNLLAESDA